MRKLILLVALLLAVPAEARNLIPSVQTTDDTWTNGDQASHDVDSTCYINYTVIATDHNGSSATWKLQATYQRVGDADLDLVGTVTETRYGRGPNSTMDVRIIVYLHTTIVQVKGVNGVTVDWAFWSEDSLCLVGTIIPP